MRYLLYIPAGEAVTFEIYDRQNVIDIDLFIELKNRESGTFSNADDLIKDILSLIKENPIINMSFIKRNNIQLPVYDSDFIIATRD